MLEVDFVLYGSKGFCAIEVKRSAHVREEDLNGLLAFQKDYPQAKLYFIYMGAKDYYDKNIHFVPAE